MKAPCSGVFVVRASLLFGRHCSMKAPCSGVFVVRASLLFGRLCCSGVIVRGTHLSAPDHPKLPQGLEDLRNGIVRTPTDPLRTFLDDPLRMLRVIRFAARFNFRIDPITYAGLQNARCQVGVEPHVPEPVVFAPFPNE